MATEAQKAAMRRYYEKRKMEKKTMLFTFDRRKDADVIDKLGKVNRSAYVCRLIREDMANGE